MRCQIRRGENNEKKLLILLITVGLIGTGAFAYFKYEEIQVRNDLIYSLQNESVQTAKGRVLDLNDKQLQKMNATISEVLVTQIYDGFIKSQPKKIANAFAISKLITIDKNDWKYSVISVGQSLPGLLEKVNLMEQSQACSDENNWRRELFGSYSTTAIMDLADYVSTGYNFYYNSAIDYYEKAMDIDYISCMNTEDDLIGEQYLILNAL